MYIIDTLGFEAHVRNMREQRGERVPKEWYKSPFWYEIDLPREKIKRHGDAVRFPACVKEADYEFEIAARFGEAFKSTSVAEAVEFVKTKMHFAIFNDLSARDLQREDRAVGIGVARSKSAPDKSFGKWVSSKDLEFDERGMPKLYQVRLWVNSRIRLMTVFHGRECWSFAETIAYFGSIGRGFKKGCILGSGTIGFGSIAETRPRYPWLSDGDVVRMETEILGVLENIVKIETLD